MINWMHSERIWIPLRAQLITTVFSKSVEILAYGFIFINLFMLFITDECEKWQNFSIS